MGVVIMTMPIMTLFMNVTVLAVVWFGGQFVIAGGMQVGDLTAFVTYVTQILMSLMMLSMILMQASRAGASLRRITEILDAKVTLTDDAAKHPHEAVQKGRVEFRDVSFTYRSIIRRISGLGTHQLYGGTGPGHRHFGRYRERENQLGTVDSPFVRRVVRTGLVDGVDVRDYTLRELRDGVGMVLQKNVLFSGTIAENLHWGDEDATDEELMRYAEHAQAAEFIDRMPDGYQTELEEGGSNVSGGQKQRLCIARALLKRPKILILDDSTSAVDTATEAKIRESFSNELRDTTVFIIAQRITR